MLRISWPWKVLMLKMLRVDGRQNVHVGQPLVEGSTFRRSATLMIYGREVQDSKGVAALFGGPGRSG
jgi:hypothetical protein